MKCPNCGIENPEEANFCRECSFSLNNELDFGTITFKRIFNPIIKYAVWFLFFSIIVVFPIFLYVYNTREKALKDYFTAQHDFSLNYIGTKDYENWGYLWERSSQEKRLRVELDQTEDFYIIQYISLGILLINPLTIFFSLLLYFQTGCFKFERPQNKMCFEFQRPFSKINGKVKKFVLEANKSEETISIREKTNGELKMKNMTTKTGQYFYLIRNNKHEALLIGNKHEAQSFIRKVFGKNIDFIEM